MKLKCKYWDHNLGQLQVQLIIRIAEYESDCGFLVKSGTTVVVFKPDTVSREENICDRKYHQTCLLTADRDVTRQHGGLE